MSELQDYRIRELEEKVAQQEEKIAGLLMLQQQFLGMSNLAQWGFKLLFLLAGTGGLTILYHIVRWLQGPMR